MNQRIGAIFSNTHIPAVAAAAALGGFVLDLHGRAVAWVDRSRIKNRVVQSSFSAPKPKVEIPRKDIQARHHVQVVVLLGHHETPAGSG